MSTIDSDGFVVESSNPNAEAVRESLGVGDVSPSTPESVARPAASAPVSEGETETPETPESGRERGADGKYVPTKKGSVQERINKAIAAQRAAERRYEALEARIIGGQASNRDIDTALRSADKLSEYGFTPKDLVPEPPHAPTGPQLADFESYEAWVDARSEWKAEQKWESIQAQQAEHAAKQRHEQAILTHTERIQTFAAKTPDYFDKIQEAASLPVSAAMEAAIIASDDGPAIAYFLATHPEEGAQLAYETQNLGTAAAPVVRRFLESKVHATTATSGPVAGGYRPNVSAPIKPVGSAPVVAEPSPDDIPFGPEYVERMNALERKKAQRRI